MKRSIVVSAQSRSLVDIRRAARLVSTNAPDLEIDLV
jgi:hypothetical protein